MARNFKRNKAKATERQRSNNSKSSKISKTQTMLSGRRSLVNKANQFIKNLSDYKFSDFEIIALGKGFNFIPNPEKPKKNVLMEAANVYARSMRIRYIAANKRWGPRHKFRNPSTWNPGQPESRVLEDYLEGMKTELSKIPIKNVQPNIAKSELQAINKLTGKNSSWFLGNHVHAHVHAQNTIDFP